MSRAERAVKRAKGVVATATKLAVAVPGVVAKAVATARDEDFQERVKADVGLLTDLARGKAKDHFGPLIKRLTFRAFFDKDPIAPTATPAAYSQPVAQA